MGNVTSEEAYDEAANVVQVHLYFALRGPFESIMAYLGIDVAPPTRRRGAPYYPDATVPILCMKQQFLTTMVATHQMYLAAPYSKTFLRARALADYFFVLSNDWHAPDLVRWNFNFADTRCDWRFSDEHYLTDTLIPLLRAGPHKDLVSKFPQFFMRAKKRKQPVQ